MSDHVLQRDVARAVQEQRVLDVLGRVLAQKGRELDLEDLGGAVQGHVGPRELDVLSVGGVVALLVGPGGTLGRDGQLLKGSQQAVVVPLLDVGRLGVHHLLVVLGGLLAVLLLRHCPADGFVVLRTGM